MNRARYKDAKPKIALVREYLVDHPQATNQDIREALKIPVYNSTITKARKELRSESSPRLADALKYVERIRRLMDEMGNDTFDECVSFIRKVRQ